MVWHFLKRLHDHSKNYRCFALSKTFLYLNANAYNKRIKGFGDNALRSYCIQALPEANFTHFQPGNAFLVIP